MTPRLSATSLILSASPRKNGNSDTAARIFYTACQNVANAMNQETKLLLQESLLAPEFLRDHLVLPCTGCDACAKKAATYFTSSLGCPQAKQDTSTYLIQKIMHVQNLCIIAPIYNYHLPAQLKGLLDRLQPFWHLWASSSQKLTSLSKEKKCCVILIAGRPKGEKLFEGSLLSVKYALLPLGFTLATPLLLKGLDTPKSLAQHREYQERISEYARSFFSLPPFSA